MKKLKMILTATLAVFSFALVSISVGHTAFADTPRYDMIDVSNHNGQMTTDEFVQMRNQYGVKAITTKISEGTTYHDWTAAGNIRAAQEAGLYINGYHYLHATTVEGAKAEAAYAVQMAQQDGLPVGAVLVADIEEPAQMAMGRDMQAVANSFEFWVGVFGGFRSTSYTMGSHTDVTPDGDKAWIASYPYTPTSDQNWYATEHGWQWSSTVTFAFSYGYFDVNQLYDDFFTGGVDTPATTPEAPAQTQPATNDVDYMRQYGYVKWNGKSFNTDDRARMFGTLQVINNSQAGTTPSAYTSDTEWLNNGVPMSLVSWTDGTSNSSMWGGSYRMDDDVMQIVGYDYASNGIQLYDHGYTFWVDATVAKNA
jgi:GH25 family lysozyme M1 (1,4-beta-N-acetylmuramidase)